MADQAAAGSSSETFLETATELQQLKRLKERALESNKRHHVVNQGGTPGLVRP